jgi:regulator of replication initiation timing
MKADTPTVILIVGVLIGPLLTYLAAARKLSGRIKDSDASELWTESRSIREWATQRVKELTDHVDELEKRMNELEHVNGELMEENKRLIREAHSLELQLAEEKAFNERLRWEAEHSPHRRHADAYLSPKEGEQQ